jgi:hypothetical protein
VFDWRAYLDLATELSGIHGAEATILLSEAASRTAVSRAYYGAFCHARNYAQQRLGYIPQNTPSDHWAVRQHFRRHGMIDVAVSLDVLRTWRNACDYDDTVPTLSTIVGRALQEAAAVIQRL